MDTERRQGIIAHGLVVTGGALALLVHVGYAFEVNDQLQYLLLPYRNIYPNFAPGDWFTWETSHYHVVYAWVIRGIFGLVGEHGLPPAVFIAYLGNLAWLCYGITRLSHAYGTGYAGAVATLAVITLVRHEGLAGATFTHGQLVPSDLALPPLLLASAAWLQRSFWRTGAWLGAAGILHSNYAILGPLLIGGAELGLMAQGAKDRGRIRDLIRISLGYLPLAAPSLWLVATGFIANDSAPEAIDTIFKVRSPHHYDLKAMGSIDLWWPLVLLAWAAPGLARHLSAKRLPSLWLFGAASGWLLVAVAGGSLSVGPLARLFLWRLSPLWVLLVLCEVARFWRPAGTAEENRWLRYLWALAGVCGLGCFARSDMALVAAFNVPAILFGLPALVAVVVASWAAMRSRILPLACATLFAMTAAFQVISAPGVPHSRAGIVRKPSMRGPRLGRFVWNNKHPHVKEQRLMRWIADHTPRDAKFLIPPSMISFRLRTRRAVFVDFKAAPMRGDEVLEWKRRMLLTIGRAHFPATGYALRFIAGDLYSKRKLRELAELARAEGLDYVVTRSTSRAGRARTKREAIVDGYGVYRVLPSSRRETQPRIKPSVDSGSP